MVRVGGHVSAMCLPRDGTTVIDTDFTFPIRKGISMYLGIRSYLQVSFYHSNV